jgi:hypothetical protein
MIAAPAITGLEIAVTALILWPKAAEALLARPTKGVAFVGLVLSSKAAEALLTRPTKGVAFVGLQ